MVANLTTDMKVMCSNQVRSKKCAKNETCKKVVNVYF